MEPKFQPHNTKGAEKIVRGLRFYYYVLIIYDKIALGARKPDGIEVHCQHQTRRVYNIVRKPSYSIRLQ
jgi:hypothetical protein